MENKDKEIKHLMEIHTSKEKKVKKKEFIDDGNLQHFINEIFYL